MCIYYLDYRSHKKEKKYLNGRNFERAKMGADEQFSDKIFAHFDPLFSEKEKKKSNFADRANINKIKFCENFSP